MGGDKRLLKTRNPRVGEDIGRGVSCIDGKGGKGQEGGANRENLFNQGPGSWRSAQGRGQRCRTEEGSFFGRRHRN